MVILFFYRGNFELVSIENGRVNFKEQNVQFLFHSPMALSVEIGQGHAIHQTVCLDQLYNISKDGLLKPFPLAATALGSLKKLQLKKN